MREWEVDFNFENGKCMSIKTGFKTKEDAEAWASKNTTDGKVVGSERIF